MNDKFLHITNILNDQYAPADIPEDIAWTEMRKLLDEDDNIVLPPPLPPMPPNGSGYWKSGLLLILILITGIAVFVNSNKQQPVRPAKYEENASVQKVNEQNKDSAPSFRNNDSLGKYKSNNTSASTVISQRANKIATTQTIERSSSQVDKNNSTPVAESLSAKNNKYITPSNTKVKTSGGVAEENNTGISVAEINGNNKNKINPKKITSKGVLINSSVTKSKKHSQQIITIKIL